MCDILLETFQEKRLHKPHDEKLENIILHARSNGEDGPTIDALKMPRACASSYSKKRIQLNLNSMLKPQGASDLSWKINRISSRCLAAAPPCTCLTKDSLDRIANVCRSAIILTQLTNLNLTLQLSTAQARFRCLIMYQVITYKANSSLRLR